MNRKIKLAVAALLGFSAACSSVKNTPAKGAGETETAEPELRVDTVHRVVVMYGVPNPRFQPSEVTIDASSVERPADSKTSASDGE